MTQTICQLAQRLKGSMQETEDWWHLKRDEDGVLFVEHSWSHTKLSNFTTDAGERRIEIDAFLEGDNPRAAEARDALRAYLAKQDGSDA